MKSKTSFITGQCIICKNKMMKEKTYVHDTEFGTATYDVYECKPCKRKEHVVSDFKMKQKL